MVSDGLAERDLGGELKGVARGHVSLSKAIEMALCPAMVHLKAEGPASRM